MGGPRWAHLATLASVCVAGGLMLAKGFVWQASGSAAILASFADSAIDLLSSIIAFVGVRMAAMPPDANHRFGHTKAEAISSLVQLILISASAAFITAESVRQITSPQPIEAEGAAFAVMLVSLAATLSLVAFQTFALHRAPSLVTEGDRAHYVSDLLGNSGTLLALLLASQFGLLWVDGLAGLVAAGFLAWAVWGLARRALPQLMDEELSDEERAEIVRIVLQDKEVLGVHALRTRRAGPTRYIQCHLELDPELSLRAAHRITDRVETALRNEFPDADLIFHQDIHGMRETHDAFGQRSASNAAE